MCGILFISNNSFETKKCDTALQLMNHRGPDNISSTEFDNHYFGHTRLAIIDLDKRSNQPFKIGSYVIIFNGEIYNYKELIISHNLRVKTDSDTEVLLLMYMKYGEKSLKHLNGMFSFIIYNTENKEVFVARDRLGIKPLYYKNQKNMLIISSEIEPILAISPDKIDDFGIRQYKKLRMTIKNHTIYGGIKNFPPGHYLKNGKFIRYWDLEIQQKNPPSDIELKLLIQDAIKIRKRADVPVGSYLSGGLDSTILSYLLKPAHTWTVGFTEMNEFDWSELANSRLGSKHYKILIKKSEFLDLSERLITKRKEPLSVPNETLILKMTREVKKENTVVLSGEGADELFWGYDRIFKWANQLKESISISEFDKYYCYGSHNDDEIIDFALEGLPGERPVDKIAYYFQIIHLQGLLRRLDSSTMMCSVEARVPFVDHRLIEMMAGTPFNWRMGNSFKEPLKRVFSDIIPQKILDRKKVGFPVPLDNIFNPEPGEYGMDKWLNYNLDVLLRS